MNMIESFKVNHLKLKTGLYVSRKDRFNGVTVTTFDMRFTAPNKEPVMEPAEIHTIEHLGATFFRNGALCDKVVYFGPMGCRTGFYLVLFGDLSPEEIYPEVKRAMEFIVNFTGEIPGATARECGNYLDQDLAGAKKRAAEYLRRLESDKVFKYEE